jgi:hypothetical protein
MAVTRRQALKCMAVSLAAAAAPPALSLAPEEIAASAPLLPAWTVGTIGEYDWQCIRAPDAQSAILEYLENETGWRACIEANVEIAGASECECDFCIARRRLDVKRVEAFDAIVNPTRLDWLEAGLGKLCERCDYEVDNSSAEVVDGDVVCHDCMTLADWRIADPERAAEMESERASFERALDPFGDAVDGDPADEAEGRHHTGADPR